MLTVVNCGINNLRSVVKALQSLGHEVEVVHSGEQIRQATHLILPGVGAYGTAMKALTEANLTDAILDHAAAEKPFLGICLGMQLLFDWSEELGIFQGLGLLSGKVVKFPGFANLKIPHMGWNKLQYPRQGRLFAGIPEESMVYFVHSYYAVPDDESLVAATSPHGLDFTAAVERNNLAAVQFHPEKSSAVGLQILDNFARF